MSGSPRIEGVWFDDDGRPYVDYASPEPSEAAQEDAEMHDLTDELVEMSLGDDSMAPF